MRWTSEQHRAIYSEDQPLLVAAAAGSGKTAVLVERIIQKVLSEDCPINIDALLVVTFTNAAAQEMKNRVGEALEKALEKSPQSNYLKKQLSLLQKAHISTLHSFCMNVVRKYAYLLDIDPGFRVADEMEIDLMKQEVLDECLEHWYSKEGEELKQFFDTVDRFSSDRSDQDFENLILELYDFSVQHPWPELWLEKILEAYDWDEEHGDDIPWLKILKKEVNNRLHAMKDEIERTREITTEPDGPLHYLEAIEKDHQMVEEALKYLKNYAWDDLQEFINRGNFVRLSGKRFDCDEVKRKQVRALRDRYRKRWQDMKSQWFRRSLEHHIADLKELKESIEQIIIIVKDFSRRYSETKKEKAIVDFNDLEHYCLELLIEKTSSVDKIQPSVIAKHYQQQFEEILVDEYQDTNDVQEMIIRLLSKRFDQPNTFMVGDVKQSIYRFRHAEPTLFIKKYHTFSEVSHKGERIDLASNFRSREHILTGTNFIFRQIMDEELGEIDYDSSAELIYANKKYDEFAFEEPHPELLLIDREEKEEDEDELKEELTKAQLEARAYGQRIKEWIEKPLKVVDESFQRKRNIQYKDIVILLRSMTWAPVIVEELKKLGIPVYAELTTGYFQAIEIQIMLSYLKIIDNPKQDIPLASVLRSPIVGLNENELTKIRLVNRTGNYYDALLEYIQVHDDALTRKLNTFLAQLRAFRDLAKEESLANLIWNIYHQTGYYDYVGGIPGGKQRQANLRALYDRARSYETTAFRGLFRFLRMIERMEERGDDLGAARALSEQEDVVRVMTIHKSKGLEFPVVIVGGLSRPFNFQDLRKRYMMDKDFGFASRYIHPTKRIVYPTLFYHALREKKINEQLSEELRVLYVALTRAKEKLLMVAEVPSVKKQIEKWSQLITHPSWVLPAYARKEAKNYLDWVGPALLRHQDNHLLREEDHDLTKIPKEIYQDISRWNIKIIHEEELQKMSKEKKEEEHPFIRQIYNWEKLELEDKLLEKVVDERLSYVYPLQSITKLQAKQSVTEIKRQRESVDEYSARFLPRSFSPYSFKRPQFMQAQKELTATERGTVYHTVMQHLPFQKVLTIQEIKEELERMMLKEIITEEERKVIDVSLIHQFYFTPIAQKMIENPDFYREVPFTLMVPVLEIYPEMNEATDENVLVQGVIDCLIPRDDGWILLDYKTDQINEEITPSLENRLIKRYEVQMEFYRRAVQEILKKPVLQTYLYFFDKQLLIEVPF